MPTKKTDTKSKKADVSEKKVKQDPVKEWQERLIEIGRERQTNEEHREHLEKELRRLTGKRKAHELYVKEKAAIEFKAQKGKSSGALLDSILQMEKGKTSESLQLEMNILALQGALSECHAEAKRLNAEGDLMANKIKQRAITNGIHAFNDAKGRFLQKYGELRHCYNELCNLSRANGELDGNWIGSLNKTTTPDEVKPKSKLDFQFTLIFEPNRLPTRTLGNVLERLRSFGDTFGPNPFHDPTPNVEETPTMFRDDFKSGGPVVVNRQEANLQSVLDRVIPDTFQV